MPPLPDSYKIIQPQTHAERVQLENALNIRAIWDKTIAELSRIYSGPGPQPFCVLEQTGKTISELRKTIEKTRAEFCQTYGFDQRSAKTLRRYFNLPNVTPLTEPAIAELGGDCYLVYAASNNIEETFRAVLTSRVFLSVGQQELRRWQKLSSHPRKKTPL